MINKLKAYLNKITVGKNIYSRSINATYDTNFP